MKSKRYFLIAACFLAAFAVWTAAICFVDIQPIGPKGSCVGFAALNGRVHTLVGVHMTLYYLTDWLGLVPIGFAFGFSVLGLAQWISRKHIGKVDRSILVLGSTYIVVLGIYLLFETVHINFRPVLIDGCLEGSYPSSTTLLVLCIMPTAFLQLKDRIRIHAVRRCTLLGIGFFTAFMVIGRFISGVHWFSDIIGSLLFSAGLVTMYYAVCRGGKP